MISRKHALEALGVPCPVCGATPGTFCGAEGNQRSIHNLRVAAVPGVLEALHAAQARRERRAAKRRGRQA
jgi:hypothetical protein